MPPATGHTPLLLDTHTLFWVLEEPDSLSRRAYDYLHDPSREILVSAASAWEIGNKVRKGKWLKAAALEGEFVSRVTSAGYRLIDISAQEALFAARLAGSHKDPFDRILAAQALSLNIEILSIDPALDAFGVRRIW